MTIIKTLVVIALGFLLSASICQARLGETEAQCIARYGQELEVAYPPYMWERIAEKEVNFRCQIGQEQFSYVIKVDFLNGVVGQEFITIVNDSVISASTLTTILNAESGGYSWKKGENKPHSEIWMREDGATAESFLANSGKKSDYEQVIFESKQYIDAYAEYLRKMNQPPPPEPTRSF